MVEYKVRIPEILRSEVNWEGISRSLEQLHEEMNSVYRNISFRIRSREQIDRNLRHIMECVSKQSEDASLLGNASGRYAEQYLKTEQLVIAKYGGNLPEQTSEKKEETHPSSGVESPKWWESLFDLIGEVGPLGSLINLVSDVGWSKNQQFDILKDIAKFFETGAPAIADIMDGTTTPLAAFFGMNGEPVKGFGEALSSQLDDFFEVGGTSTASKTMNTIGVVAKWAGVVFTAASNFAENYEEFDGDLSNPRIYQETFGESVVDIGLSIGATAAVAALIGTTGGAALIGCGVVMGVNALWKRFTSTFGEEEKDLSESISDGFWDLVGMVTGAKEEKTSTAWQPALA